MREMDLVMGRFADATIADLTEVELAEFEALSDLPDPDLYAWVTGDAEVPPDVDSPLFRKLCAFHAKGAA